MSCLAKRFRQFNWQILVQLEPHAWFPISATKRPAHWPTPRHSRSPSARLRVKPTGNSSKFLRDSGPTPDCQATVVTRIRVPAMHALPWHISGSTAIWSRQSIVFVPIVSHTCWKFPHAKFVVPHAKPTKGIMIPKQRSGGWARLSFWNPASIRQKSVTCLQRSTLRMQAAAPQRDPTYRMSRRTGHASLAQLRVNPGTLAFRPPVRARCPRTQAQNTARHTESPAAALNPRGPFPALFARRPR